MCVMDGEIKSNIIVVKFRLSLNCDECEYWHLEDSTII
jgi:hypothetical protein